MLSFFFYQSTTEKLPISTLQLVLWFKARGITLPVKAKKRKEKLSKHTGSKWVLRYLPMQTQVHLNIKHLLMESFTLSLDLLDDDKLRRSLFFSDGGTFRLRLTNTVSTTACNNRSQVSFSQLDPAGFTET